MTDNHSMPIGMESAIGGRGQGETSTGNVPDTGSQSAQSAQDKAFEAWWVSIGRTENDMRHAPARLGWDAHAALTKDVIEAVSFARSAIMDAISLEDGLDAKTGEAVIGMIDRATSRLTERDKG